MNTTTLIILISSVVFVALLVVFVVFYYSIKKYNKIVNGDYSPKPNKFDKVSKEKEKTKN